MLTNTEVVSKLKKRVNAIEESLAQAKAMLVLFQWAEFADVPVEDVLKDLKALREANES